MCSGIKSFGRKPESAWSDLEKLVGAEGVLAEELEDDMEELV